MIYESSSTINQEITSKVAHFYEKFPYPYYPLIARPHYPDAYLSSSEMLGILASELTSRPCGVLAPAPTSKQQHRILVLGCGDTQPYLFKKWEPSTHHLSFVDLSHRSIIRARLRFGLYFRQVDWINDDLYSYLGKNGRKGEKFKHMDAYGVLHHLAHPNDAIKLIAENLAPSGTLKLMIYNQAARDWIHEIQKIFKLCKLDPYVNQDRLLAKKLLLELAKLKSLKDFFLGLGPGIFKNHHRLCDTFFNEREVKWLPIKWIELLESNGLSPISLFDRYGELDDLTNPLWKFPRVDELKSRYLDKRFENNLEILAVKKESIGQSYAYKKKRLIHPIMLRPPQKWFNYSETKHTSRSMKNALWKNFLNKLAAPLSFSPHLTKIGKNNVLCLKRLARLGAIFPSDAKRLGYHSIMINPICEEMETPQRPKLNELPHSLLANIQYILSSKNLDEKKRLALITERILKINQQH